MKLHQNFDLRVIVQVLTLALLCKKLDYKPQSINQYYHLHDLFCRISILHTNVIIKLCLKFIALATLPYVIMCLLTVIGATPIFYSIFSVKILKS